jgi:hypothetical protein
MQEWKRNQVFAFKVSNLTVKFIELFFFFFETKDRQTNAKAQEAVDHLTSFSSDREEISRLGFEPPNSSLRFGYLSTIIP